MWSAADASSSRLFADDPRAAPRLGTDNAWRTHHGPRRVITDLPPDWEAARIGDLGTEVRGQVSPEPGTIYDLYSVPAYATGEPEQVDGESIRSGKRPVEEHDVLLCKINPRINRVWTVGASHGQPQIASTEYLVLRLHEPRMAAYVRYYLSSPGFRDWIKLAVEGATGSHTRAKSGPILEQLVPVPPPLEQQQMVATIEEHFSRLDAANASLDAAKLRCQALLKSILVGAIPSELPPCWRMTTVDEAGETGLGRQRSPKYHSGPNMKPYLRVANVFEDRIDASDIMEMHFDATDFDKYRLEVGDVLLNEGQSPEFLGRPAIYRGDPPNIAFTNSLIRFVPGPDVISEWALLVFRRHMHSGRFMKESRITTNIAHLALGRFRTVEFPVPPLEVQGALVAATRAALDSVDRTLEQIRSAVARTAALRRSVLASAFGGHLLPQGPDVEPAADLTG